MGMERIMSSGDSKKKKSKRIRQKKVTPVQKLYDTCQDVFANCGPGVVPSVEGIQRLKHVLS
ncbi:hypothetical protein M8C21_006548 [Ambrosia artemisiifolia]|uniref:Uncharacterized protein n=1 Tax=Ambrosia artemisiifolia TaxID=4212 RepID=A0AAD5G6T7_AMBAR|nr:hypothetical protein M8C21_006548 [Ambrosia artemisiifolia]